MAKSKEQRAKSKEQRAKSKEQRAYYFDFLRVAGSFAVIVLHVSARNWYTTSVSSYEWNIMNFYDGIVRWAVPVFVMISGALFLSKDIPIRKIFSKYIFRIFTAFVFWSLIYAANDYVHSKSFITAAKNLIPGHYHMWFLFMITGLYMIVPFMKKIAEQEFLTQYFLVLSFVFALILPQSINIISQLSIKHGNFAFKAVNNFHMNFVAGYTLYFLLGHVVNKADISARTERIIYFSGIAGFIFTVIMTFAASFMKNAPTEIFYSNLTVNVFCESIAVFVYFKKHCNFSVKLIRLLSQYSFGAYLVHDAVISLIDKLGLSALTFNPIFAIPAASMAVFVISFTISAVLNHIPVLKKYIV